MFIEIPNTGTINTEEISEVTESIIYQGHKGSQYKIIMKNGREHTVNDQDYSREFLSNILLNPLIIFEPSGLEAETIDVSWETIIATATKGFVPFTPKPVKGKFFHSAPRPR